MATTGIWKIEKRLDHVIEYITNDEKTINDSFGKEIYYDLHNIKGDVNSVFDGEKQFFVSSLNCQVDSAFQEMMITKEEYNAKNGILGFHAFQSFVEGEVTPELAHTIGVKLAEEMWGDRFEVIISTHLNTSNIHNHFVINSVSFKDGKRYYDKRSTYAELRHLSDSLCSEYGLSILEEKACRRSKINFANYYNGEVKSSNYYTLSKKDIDRAIAMAYSYTDFENLMKAMNYELIYRSNKLSIRRDPYKKNIRIERSFGEEYSITRIKERIEIEHSTRLPFIEEYGKKKKYIFKNDYKKQKRKGIYRLYLHYCYLLKVFPKKNPYYKLPACIRADVIKMEQISEETRLLIRNKLKTDEQFFSFKRNKECSLERLLDMKSKLWYRYKKCDISSEKQSLLKEIGIISKDIKRLRKDVKLCEGIEDRVMSIQKNIDKMDEETRKEVVKNEYIK